MSRTRWIWIIILICLLLPGVAAAEGEAPTEVQRAAEAGLPEYVAALPAGALADFGFPNAEEARRATLGQPYRIHILSPSALSNDLSEQSLASRLQLTDMWLYPVLVEGEPRTILLVVRMPEGYRAVQLGNTVLPPLLTAWEARLPDQAEQRGLSSYQVRFVRMPQVYCDFLLITAASEEYVAPLHLSSELRNPPADQLQPMKDMLPALSEMRNREGTLADEMSGPAGGAVIQPRHSSSTTLMWTFGVVALTLAAGTYTLLLRSRVSKRKQPSKFYAIAIVACGIVLFLAATISTQLQEPSTLASRYLDIPDVQQEQDQWCWAGCARAVFLYYGQDVAQCTVADYNWGRADCCTSPTSPACNNWTYLIPNVQNILSHWSVDSSALWSSTSFNTVRSEINSDRPVWVRWGWSGGGGHFVVIRGYNDDSGNKVLYMDPWYGANYLASYSWVVSGDNHTWTHSLTGIRYVGTPPTPTPTETTMRTPTPTATGVTVRHRVLLPILCKEYAPTAWETPTPSASPTATQTLGPTDCLIESVHPYPSDYDNTWTLLNPDFMASTTRLHFSRLETEGSADWVIIRDGNRVEIQRLSGNYAGGVWTNEVPGRVVLVQLISNPSVVGWGFCVDEISSGAATPTMPVKTLTPGATATTIPSPTVTPTWPPAVPVEVAITAGGGQQLRPEVACNTQRGDYLVVWQERVDSPDIYAQRVSASGALLGGRIPVSTAPQSQQRPVVAYNSQRDEYLVVWQDGTGEQNPSGHNYIHAQRVSWNGGVLGNVIVVSRATNWQVEPDVAYNIRDDEYLVVWRDGAVNVHGQRVSGTGGLLGSNFPICTASRQQNCPSVAYNSNGNEYFVVWDDYRNHRDYDIYGRRVSAGGSLPGDETAICTMGGDQWKPDVAFCPVTSEYLVAWPDYSVEPTQLFPDVLGTRISEHGAVHGQFTLSTAQGGQWDPAIAFNPVASEYLVVWTNNPPWDIHGQRLSPGGHFLGSTLVLTTNLEKQHLPAIAVNTASGGYLIAWEDWRSQRDFDIYAYVQP
jgi:hypothetical protein